MPISLGLGLGTASGGGIPAAITFDTDASALFARITTPPDSGRKSLINSLILSLKTGAVSGSNIWAKLDFLHIYAAADSQAALLNWKSNVSNGTLVSAPTFAADRGFTTDGVASYIDCNYNPTTFSSPQFVQDSGGMGLWTRTGAQSTGTDMGIRQGVGTKQTLLVVRNTSNVIVFRINMDASPATNGSSTDGTGHTFMRRSSSTVASVFKNAVFNQTWTQASVSPANLGVFVGCVNLTGAASAFAAREYSVAYMGSSLTDNEVTDMHNALNAYLVSVGAA